jgi:hypothetical protein
VSTTKEKTFYKIFTMLLVLVLNTFMLPLTRPPTENNQQFRLKGRHDNHHNDIQHNDTQDKEIIPDTQHT